MRNTETDEIILEPENIYRLSMLCGPGDENLLQIEKRLGVAIEYDGGSFRITGYPGDIKAAEHVLNELYTDTAPIRGKIGEITPRPRRHDKDQERQHQAPLAQPGAVCLGHHLP